MNYNFRVALTILAISMITFTACEKETLPTTIYNTDGAVALTSNVVNGFFDLTDDNTFVGFDLATQGADVNSVLIRKTFTPAGGDESAPIDHATVSPPSNGINVTLADALNGFSVAADDLAPGDEFNLYFTCNTTDGRTLRTGSPLNIKVSCSSSLAGTHTHTTTTSGWCEDTVTGEVVWTEEGPGQYSIDDFAFNTYVSCYNGFDQTPDGDLRVNDVCNGITITGASQWGEIYSWSITNVNGTEMVIEWSNDYGENGITTLTNGNGEDWPALFTP